MTAQQLKAFIAEENGNELSDNELCEEELRGVAGGGKGREKRMEKRKDREYKKLKGWLRRWANS